MTRPSKYLRKISHNVGQELIHKWVAIDCLFLCMNAPETAIPFLSACGYALADPRAVPRVCMFVLS